MSEDVMKNYLAAQCMDFTRYLADKGHVFKFSLKMQTFSFNLETTETRIPSTVNVFKKKRDSPSTLARNAKRRTDFLAKKRSVCPEEKESVVGDPAAVKENVVGDDVEETAVDDDHIAVKGDMPVDLSNLCEFCEFNAASPAGLELHMTRRHKTILQIDGVDGDSKDEGTGSEMDDISDDDSEQSVKVVEMDEEDEDDDESVDSRDAESRCYEAERVPVLIEDRDAEKIPVLIDDGCHTSGVVIDEGNDLIKHVTNMDEEVSHEAEKVPGLIEVRDAEDDEHVKYETNNEENRCKLCPPGTKEYCENMDFLKHLVIEHYSGQLLKYFPFIKGQACKMCNEGFAGRKVKVLTR